MVEEDMSIVSSARIGAHSKFFCRSIHILGLSRSPRIIAFNQQAILLPHSGHSNSSTRHPQYVGRGSCMKGVLRQFATLCQYQCSYRFPDYFLFGGLRGFPKVTYHGTVWASIPLLASCVAVLVGCTRGLCRGVVVDCLVTHVVNAETAVMKLCKCKGCEERERREDQGGNGGTHFGGQMLQIDRSNDCKGCMYQRVTKMRSECMLRYQKNAMDRP